MICCTRCKDSPANDKDGLCSWCRIQTSHERALDAMAHAAREIALTAAVELAEEMAREGACGDCIVKGLRALRDLMNDVRPAPPAPQATVPGTETRQ